MSSKNKKSKDKSRSKSKARKTQTNTLKRVEETFYQLTVADCEKKIDRLRKHLENLDVSNVEIKERIRSLNEDKIDRAGDLTRDAQAADERIFILNEKIYKLSQEYFEHKKRGDATITDLEEKYKAMHDQLTAQIKSLKAQLNMLNEYPKIQEKLNLVNELQEERKKYKEAENKEAIESLERRIKGERELLRKEMEREMLHVSEKFTRSSNLRNAAYTQRLIRENIALEKEIKILESTWKSMEQTLKEQVARHKEVKATFPALNQKKRELILVAQQKTNLIEELTTKNEKLKKAYMESLLYKNQYQDLIEYQLCSHYKRNELLKEAKKLGTHIHTIKSECVHMNADFDRNKIEIENVKQIIALIRKTILKAIGVDCLKLENQNKTEKTEIERKVVKMAQITNEKQLTSAFAEETLIAADSNMLEEFEEEAAEEVVEEEEQEAVENQPKNLLQTLFDILNYYKLHKISTSSIETLEPDRFLINHPELCQKSSDSLREAFKYGKTVVELGDKFLSDLGLPPQGKFKILPKERLERCPLFDVEKGSTLYVSLSESHAESYSAEEKIDENDFPQDSSSFSQISVKSEAKEQEAPPIVEKQTSLQEMPAGTIIDVEMMDEEEQNLEEENEMNKQGEDDNIYLNTDENTSQNFIVDELGEEEMSIYMFY